MRKAFQADAYALRRSDGQTMMVTNHLLSCFFDLRIEQAAAALRVSPTTVKQMRIWARIPSWPCQQIMKGQHELTEADVRDRRRSAMADTLRCSPVIYDALARAFHMRPEKSAALDYLDALDCLDASDSADPAPDTDASDPTPTFGTLPRPCTPEFPGQSTTPDTVPSSPTHGWLPASPIPQFSEVMMADWDATNLPEWGDPYWDF